MNFHVKNLPFQQVVINDGFWNDKQSLIRKETVWAIYKRFQDTGRFASLNCDWDEQRDGSKYRPHFFWDSDIAKWIEGVGYLCVKQREPELEKLADDAISAIVAHQWPDGYISSYFTRFKEKPRFTDRTMHELYTIGHLVEAAIAYDRGTGKDTLLRAMEKCVNCVQKIFMEEHSAGFVTPGHEEIELALVRLYCYTEKKQYLQLAQFFIDQRGVADEPQNVKYDGAPYNQSHLPVRKQTIAEGHAVRAVYLYCGMADVAKFCDDSQLLNTCKALMNNITNRRMYVTGGIGSQQEGETFTRDFHLPNETAYAETCAAIGLMLFAGRMQTMEENSLYADTFEQVLYNGFLSGMSLTGNEFFYENPLAIPAEDEQLPNTRYPINQRVKVFECSCCPPNICRFIPSIGQWLYSNDEENKTIYVQQYVASEATFSINNQACRIVQETEYPFDGKITIKYNGIPAVIALRVPGWCHNYTGETKNGYAYFNVTDGDAISVEFKMEPTLIVSDQRVFDNRGRVAVQRGPFVYCLESIDNGNHISHLEIKENTDFKVDWDRKLNLPVLYATGCRISDSEKLYSTYPPKREETSLRLIPYCAFANRGKSEMQIWTTVK